MNNPNFDKEVEIINKLEFKRLENIKCGELLSTKLFYQPKECSFSNAFKSLISPLNIMFKSHIYLETDLNGKVAMFFTPSYAGRFDHFNDFMSVASCIEKPIVFNGNVQKISLKLYRFSGLLYWIIWLMTMIKTGLSLTRCVSLCNTMLQAFYVLEELKKYNLDKNGIKLAITLCDVHPADYLITDYYNQLGIKTATLQHAVFYHGTQSYCYRFSHSDYFLALSEYCRNEALKSDYKGIVKVVGLMKSISMSSSTDKKKPWKTDISSFGLALCGPTFSRQNSSLLNYAEYLQNKYGLKAIIRFHPALKKEDYMEGISKLSDYEISKDSFNEFASRCGFVILGATNMFAELISFNKPAFRLVSDGIEDIYDGINEFKFENCDELDGLIKLTKDKEGIFTAFKKVKGTLCPDGDIKELYRDTIKNIINS